MSSSDLYESDDEELLETPSITPRAARGTRVRALKALRSSLPEASVESYTQLLHRTFQNKLETKDDNFNTTQDGIVIWTPQEKRIFFEILDKKGRNGIREIAASIGSKSELEIQEYIRLLQKGVRRQHFNDTHSRTALLGDIPAAAEISEQCCESLDEYAELLCLEEQRGEDNSGKIRHEGLWIINKEVGEKLEADAAESESRKDPLEVDQEVAVQVNETQGEKLSSRLNVNAAAALFKIPKWILLSERLFMNFGGQRLEDNWVNVAFKGETPSLTADAFTDFYEIALKVTRRLVHATHFFASSRVLKSGKTSRPSATVVKSSDVRRAARTLNMKSDSSEFWIGVARRCSLDVEDKRHRKGWNPVSLDHDEAEALLSQRTLPKEPYERTTPSPGPDLGPRERSNSATSDISLDSLEQELNDSEDAHADAIDQQQSSTEELLCWTTLGQSRPENSNPQILQEQLPPKPSGKRKTTEELVDWRDRTLYRSEWEEYGYEAEKLESGFESQRKKRRLTTSFQPPSRSNKRVTNAISPSTKEQTTAEFGYQTDDTDPEFQPGSLPQVPTLNSKVISRTSSRKRTPVSYAPQQTSGFDMDMEIDSELDHEKSRDPDNQQSHHVVSQQEVFEEENVSSSSDDYLPSPQERSFSPSDQEEVNDDDQNDRHVLSTPSKAV